MFGCCINSVNDTEMSQFDRVERKLNEIHMFHTLWAFFVLSNRDNELHILIMNFAGVFLMMCSSEIIRQ